MSIYETIEQNNERIRQMLNDTLVDTCIHNKEFIKCFLNTDRMILRLPHDTLIQRGDIIHHSDKLLIVDYVSPVSHMITVVRVHYQGINEESTK